MEIKKAQKKKVKLRIGMSGASGFGKTYSALLLAYGIVGDWSKICVIDTENDSASLYSDLGEFNTISLKAPFSPERYVEAVKTCENAGMECIIVDSITHEWDGQGGCLQICEELTQASASKNSYFAWGKVTPRHDAFIQSILQSNCHVITTVRRKQDYETSKDERGKISVVKTGTKEITRDGFEYELTINFEFLSDSHYVKASKDRTSMFANKPEFVITVETGKKILEWANAGVDEVAYICDSIKKCTSRNDLTNLWKSNAHLQNNPSVKDAFAEMCKIYPKES